MTPRSPVWIEHDKGCILLKCEAKIGIARTICQIMAREGINIEYMVTATMPKEKEGTIVIIVSAANLKKAIDVLKSARKEIALKSLKSEVLTCITVDIVKVRHVPGVGAKLFAEFAERKIGVLIAITTAAGMKFYVRPEDATPAIISALRRLVE